MTIVVSIKIKCKEQQKSPYSTGHTIDCLCDLRSLGFVVLLSVDVI